LKSFFVTPKNKESQKLDEVLWVFTILKKKSLHKGINPSHHGMVTKRAFFGKKKAKNLNQKFFTKQLKNLFCSRGFSMRRHLYSIVDHNLSKTYCFALNYVALFFIWNECPAYP
jgi:hypothetical protein